MKASRSRREVTSEISMFDTKKNDYAECCCALDDFQQRFSHFFLAKQKVNEQHIQRDKLEPKVINRLAEEQKEKQNQHARVGH